jgi:hypothetical protein
LEISLREGPFAYHVRDPGFDSQHWKEKTGKSGPMAHTCNPSYLGCRDQEDHGLKPARAKSSKDPISKNPSEK